MYCNSELNFRISILMFFPFSFLSSDLENLSKRTVRSAHDSYYDSNARPEVFYLKSDVERRYGMAKGSGQPHGVWWKCMYIFIYYYITLFKNNKRML